MQNKTAEELASELPRMLPSFNKGLTSQMGVPLISQDVVIGSLIFRTTGDNAFEDGHLAMAERIADQIAGAVANSELNRTLEREVTEKAALAGQARGLVHDWFFYYGE